MKIIYNNQMKKHLLERKWYLMKYYLKDVNHNFIRNKIYVPQNFMIPYEKRYETIDFKPKYETFNPKKSKSTLEGIKINKTIPFKERYECRDF